MTLWVSSELDRSNICAKPKHNRPNASNDIAEFGLKWDNSQCVSDDNFVLMDFAKNNGAWLELGLHAVRHEHWPKAGGPAELSEFGRPNAKKTWGFDVHTNALDCFTELPRQHHDEEVCSFPKSFIAPGHKCHCNPNDLAHSTGAAASSHGVKCAQRPRTKDHFDASLHVTNRDTVVAWDGCGVMPKNCWSDGSCVNTHPPNVFDVTKILTWIAWLKKINNLPGRHLPKNAVQTQTLCHKHATHSHNSNNNKTGGTLTIDNAHMPSLAHQHNILGTLVLKTEGSSSCVSTAKVNHGAQVMAVWRDEFGYECLLVGNPHQPMGQLEPKVYQLECALGDKLSVLDNVVHVEPPWTCEVFSLHVGARNASLMVEMCGRQTTALRLSKFAPVDAKSASRKLTLEHWKWNATTQELLLDVTGTDMQGEIGTIFIQSARSSGSFAPLSLEQMRLGHPNSNCSWPECATVGMLQLLAVFSPMKVFGRRKKKAQKKPQHLQ